MRLERTIKAIVRRGENYYVAECLELAVVTQGKTVDETLANLREAVALHLEGEDPAEFGFVSNPTVLVTMELETISA
jgi:predicted RNase H-like HicB family nuclease